MNYDRESQQMLTFLLKKIKGIKTLKIIDANFVYTEEHSRRLKLKLTVQKELDKGASLQDSFIVEFTENYQQCEDCQKSYTPHIWSA